MVRYMPCNHKNLNATSRTQNYMVAWTYVSAWRIRDMEVTWVGLTSQLT